nr:hypothetical protein [Propionicimonas sp.]
MDSTARFGWWPVLQFVVAVAAIALGVSLVLVWAANLALTEAVTSTIGQDAVVSSMQVLGWVELGLSVIVLAGLAVGAWLHRPLWARGVASVIVGMTLHWGWWVLDRRFDLFGMAGLPEGDPLLVSRAEARLWTMLAIDVAAVLALVLGGVLLVRHRSRGRDTAAGTDEDDDELVPAAE